MQKKFGKFGSSEDPQKLGDTIKGVFGLLAVIVAAPSTSVILSLLGVDANLTDLSSSLEAMGTGAAMVIVNSFIVFGLIKKVFVFVWDKWLSRIDILN